MCDVKWLETLSLSTSYGNVIVEESKPRQLHEVVTSAEATTTSYLRTFYYRTLRLLFIIVTVVFLCN